MKKNKIDIFKIFLGIVALSFILFCVLLSNQNKILTVDMDGLVQIETLSSGVQRISKLELENSSDDSLMVLLDNIIQELSLETSTKMYFENEEELRVLVENVVSDWYYFQDTVMNFRENGNRDLLFLASEEHYKQSTLAIQSINVYITSFSSMVNMIETGLIAHVALMALLLVKILFNTLAELQKNKELSKDMFIDLSTGLYNRSKCQSVLKSPITPNNIKERAVVIFDLNDLKKTNDSLGHRAGDQLIATFAEQLKIATNIFQFEVFVGRYGGDEFMASFDYAEEKDVLLYIDEVNFLMQKLNDSGEKPFKLSCAAGYSITTPETKAMTMRELFDAADANMYQNKIAMKAKRKQELLEQGIEEPVVEDDRLS